MRRLLTFLLLLTAVLRFSTAPASAQSGTTLRGSLTDSLTDGPIGNATVVIEEIGRQVRSRADGTFALEGVPPGTYHLLVRADKFMPHRSEVTVGGAGATADLRIDPEMHYSEVMSVSPGARNQFESYQPTTVLAGQDLEKERQATLGETLQNEPGLSVRSLGPGPSRPVIRGLDGDRVLILQDGQRMGDLSSQSADHGVNVNPGAATRIEVVRGPATLLYGANAIGGLVNVITEDVPTGQVVGATGSMSMALGSAASEAGGGGDVTVGNGKVALHLAGSGRRSGNYGTPDGSIPNSFSRGAFGGAGLSWTGQNGYFGGSVGYDRTHYGVPLIEEGETNLDPRRAVVTLRGERRNLNGLFSSVRGSLGVRRYRHDELDGQVVATQFRNNTLEFDLLANHRPFGKLKGSVGAWMLGRSFSTEGEEALSPAVDQKAYAGFVYEEVGVNSHLSVQFGGRLEHVAFTPDSTDPARNFTNVSGSFGLLVHPTEATTLAVNVARAARNPALEELYFLGPHRGNFAFETGNADLESEKALGFDVSMRWRGRRTSGELTYFFNSIDNFIYREFTGAVEDNLPETFFTAGDSRLQGLESHVDVALNSVATVEAGVDYVRGELTASGQPLLRIPPLRGRLGLRLQKNAFQAGGDLILTAEQNRIQSVDGPDGPIGELPTPGSQILKLFAAYSFQNGKSVNTITARLDNAGNQLYRNHLNYLKELVPEVGRNFRLLYNVRF